MYVIKSADFAQSVNPATNFSNLDDQLAELELLQITDFKAMRLPPGQLQIQPFLNPIMRVLRAPQCVGEITRCKQIAQAFFVIENFLLFGVAQLSETVEAQLFVINLYPVFRALSVKFKQHFCAIRAIFDRSIAKEQVAKHLVQNIEVHNSASVALVQIQTQQLAENFANWHKNHEVFFAKPDVINFILPCNPTAVKAKLVEFAPGIDAKSLFKKLISLQANRPETILQLHIQLTELITLFPIITRYEEMLHQSIKTAPFRIALLKFYFTSLSMMLFSPSCTEAYEQYMRSQLKVLGTKVTRSVSYFGPSFVEVEVEDATDDLAQAALLGIQQRQVIVKAEENCVYCHTNNKTSIIICSCGKAFVHTACYDQMLAEHQKAQCPNLNCKTDFAFDWKTKGQDK